MPSGTLILKNITRVFDTPSAPLSVLGGIDLEIKQGQTVAIVGPSGSGKSTLLNIIGSLDKPTSGQVFFDDQEVTSLAGQPLADFRSRNVGFVFQEHHLLDQLTALENILLPTLALTEKSQSLPRAKTLMEQVGILEKADNHPATMSGGQRQRTAITRAMINNPKLLLCDEPTGNLDQDTARTITRLFLDLAADNNITIIMVTHNMELARMFSQCYSLQQGRLTQTTVQ